MNKPTSIKGHQLVGALWYYHCHCGEPQGPLLLTGFAGGIRPGNNTSVLLNGDGVLFKFCERFSDPLGVVLVREVGRVRCTCSCTSCTRLQSESGDHVWYDWRFES